VLPWREEGGHARLGRGHIVKKIAIQRRFDEALTRCADCARLYGKQTAAFMRARALARKRLDEGEHPYLHEVQDSQIPLEERVSGQQAQA